MLKVVQPARLINSMGTNIAPEIDFSTGDSWDVENGSLTLYDASGLLVGQFAPGHWSHIVLVD